MDYQRLLTCLNPDADTDISVCPAGLPPEGVMPLDLNAPSLHSNIVAAAAICMTGSIVLVAIRLFTKGYVLREVQVEDCKRNIIFS